MSERTVTNEIHHTLQMSDLGEVRSSVLRLDDETVVTAIQVGEAAIAEAPLVRVHSRCLYAEVFRSMDCDCHEQRVDALRAIRNEGSGLFLYLEQEGRNSGLTNKARAYALRNESHLDTVEAYSKLGLDVDSRSYGGAAAVLKHFGVKRIRLLTNNPRKVDELGQHALEVTRVPLRTEPTEHNRDYLRAKQEKLDHDLGLPELYDKPPKG